MLPHDRTEYQQQMGHVWLGFSEETVRRYLATAGFTRRAVPGAAGGSRRARARRCSSRRDGRPAVSSKFEVQEFTVRITRREDDGNCRNRDPRIRRGPQGGTRTLQGEGPLAGRVRPQRDPPRRARDAGPDGAARAATARRSRWPARASWARCT